MISTSSFLGIGEQDRDLDGDGEGDLRDKFCGGVSSRLSGSVGSVNRGNGLVGKENLGIDICGGGFYDFIFTFQTPTVLCDDR